MLRLPSHDDRSPPHPTPPHPSLDSIAVQCCVPCPMSHAQRQSYLPLYVQSRLVITRPPPLPLSALCPFFFTLYLIEQQTCRWSTKRSRQSRRRYSSRCGSTPNSRGLMPCLRPMMRRTGTKSSDDAQNAHQPPPVEENGRGEMKGRRGPAGDGLTQSPRNRNPHRVKTIDGTELMHQCQTWTEIVSRVSIAG